MDSENVERIWPTKSNLDNYLYNYPEHKQRYELASSLVKNLNCADVACGSGYGSYIISDFAESVDGFDISKEALDHAKRHFLTENICFKDLSLFNEKYDAVISLETIEHMDEGDGDNFLKNIACNLKSNGLLIISTPINNSKNKINVAPFHLREYSHLEFANKLKKNGFLVEKWYCQTNIVSQRISKEFLGFSLAKLLRTGFHKLIPKKVRNILSRVILKKNSVQSVQSCELKEGLLTGSFCQIAICNLRTKP